MSIYERRASKIPRRDLDVLDRNHLKRLTEAASGSNVYYGRGFDLEPEDIEKIECALRLVENALKPQQQNSNWAKLIQVLETEFDQGTLMSFIFPPTWLIDGGPDSRVEVVRREGRIGVQAPSEIYTAYLWDMLIKNIRRQIHQNKMTVRGTSPKELGRNLTRLSYFFT